jgi:hypothetical protein
VQIYFLLQNSPCFWQLKAGYFEEYPVQFPRLYVDGRAHESGNDYRGDGVRHANGNDRRDDGVPHENGNDRRDDGVRHANGNVPHDVDFLENDSLLPVLK